MDNLAKKNVDSTVSITKEEEGYVSATEEFPSQPDEISLLEESKMTPTLLDSPKKRQEDTKLKNSTDLNITDQSRFSPVKKKLDTQKNSPLFTKKNSMESSFPERKQNENHSEKVIPDIYNPDSTAEVLKQRRDLIVNSLEQHLKALVQDMIKQFLPSTENYQEVSEKIQNISLFPKYLRDGAPKSINEENLTSTTSQQHASSISRTRYVHQKMISEINSKRTRSKYSDALNSRNSKSSCRGKSPKKDSSQNTPKASIEKHPKTSNPSKPLLLKYTEGINGCTKELLICTADTILDVSQKNPNGQQQTDITQSLLKISNQYVGRPLHVIFNPRNLPEEESDDPVHLHPSPGIHDLLQTIQKCEERPKSANKTIQPINLKSLESFIVLSNNTNEAVEETASERKKLKIRQCRRKKSRTALKRIDIKQVVSSVFKNIFHFYALLGGHLKSGSVITRFGSNIWLKQAGVAEDERSLETASDVFMAVAGSKVVLNIFDYLKFLILYARQRRIAAVELVNQLTVCKLPQCHLRERLNWEHFRRGSSEYCLDQKSKLLLEQKRIQAHKQKWVRSLPNLKLLFPH